MSTGRPRVVNALTESDSSQTALMALLGDCDSGRWDLPDYPPYEHLNKIDEAIEGLKALNRAATMEEITTMLAHLAIHFDTPEMSDGHRRLYLKDYARHLKQFTYGDIRDCGEEYLATKKFWPKIADLVELCESIKYRRQTAIRRLERMKMMNVLPAGVQLIRTVGNKRYYRTSYGKELWFHLMTGEIQYVKT